MIGEKYVILTLDVWFLSVHVLHGQPVLHAGESFTESIAYDVVDVSL